MTGKTVHVQSVYKAFGEAAVPTIVAVDVKSQIARKKPVSVISATLDCGEIFATKSVIEALITVRFVPAMIVSGTRV